MHGFSTIMPMLNIPDLDLNPGAVICLHLPRGSLYPVPVVESWLLQQAERESMRAMIARDVEPFRGRAEPPGDQTSVEWLAEAGPISSDEAVAIIRGFRIGVAPRLCQIAANPRRFLGVAVALSRRPDVLIYETAGMDPQGRYRLHEYIVERGSEFCAVHISYPSVYGTGQPAPRRCPATAQCVELDGSD
jgi:hypothetical protein